MSFIKTYKIEIGLLSFPLLVLIALRVLGFDGMIGQDAYEYVRYIERLKALYLTGIHPGVFFWPKGYPLVASVFSIVMPTNIAAQLVSIFSLMGTFIFAKKIIGSIYKEHSLSTVYLFLALLLSPYLLRASLMSMSDMLAIFCLVASFYYYLSYKKKQLFKCIFLCVLFGVYCAFTRYAAILPVSIIFLSIALFWFKHIKMGHLFALIIPLIVLPAHLFLEVESGNTRVLYGYMTNWNFLNSFKNSFTVVDGTFDYLFPNILYGFFSFFHPGFFFFGGLLVFISLKRIKTIYTINWLVIALIVFIYALFIMGIPYQNNRHLLLTFPFVLLLLYPAFTSLLSRLNKHKILLISLIACAQFLLFLRAIQPSYQQNAIEKSVSNELVSYHDQGETLYSFDIEGAIKCRGLLFKHKSLWIKEYNSFEKGALVLFNEEKLKSQWEGENPMINWDNLKTNYKLTLINKLDAGWNLYRIE